MNCLSCTVSVIAQAGQDGQGNEEVFVLVLILFQLWVLLSFNPFERNMTYFCLKLYNHKKQKISYCAERQDGLNQRIITHPLKPTTSPSAAT